MSLAESKFNLDPRVFVDGEVKGKQDKLFGEPGKITRFGEFYLLNSGLDSGRDSIRLLVLDTDKHTLRFRNFYKMGENKWLGSWSSTDPRKEELDSAEFIYGEVHLFLSAMQGFLSGRNDDEALNVKQAAILSVQPLMDYLFANKMESQTKLSNLRVLLNHLNS